MKDNKTFQQIEFNLKVPKYYKKTWIIIGWVTLLLLVLASTIIAALYGPPSGTKINSNIKYNSGIALAASILAYISYASIGIPYLFLSACWVVGIDNITKSARFSIFIWIMYTFAAILTIIGLILSFRCYINW